MSLPDEYLDMTLRSMVALSLGRGHPRGTPCEVSTMVDAIHALDARVAVQDAARAADDAEWLALEIEQLPATFDEIPEK